MILVRSIAIATVILSTLFAAQESDSEKARDVVRSYEKGLLAIEGVREVAVHQIDGVTTISIRAETIQAKESVGILIGKKLGSFPVRIVVSTSPFADGSDKADPESSPAEVLCTHCPVHCGHPSSSQLTVVERKPDHSNPANSEPAKADPANVEPTLQEQCDVARKWMGLPRRKNVSDPCDIMVSWSDSPEKIRWVLANHLPHWRSKEMPGLRGSDKTGVNCPEHGSHNQGEIVCYTWVKHALECPLKSKVAFADVLPAAYKKAEK